MACFSCLHLMYDNDGARRCRILLNEPPVTAELEKRCRAYIAEPHHDDQQPVWYWGERVSKRSKKADHIVGDRKCA